MGSLGARVAEIYLQSMKRAEGERRLITCPHCRDIALLDRRIPATSFHHLSTGLLE